MSSINNITTFNIESWFIIISISTIITLILAILLAIIFLIIVVLNKTCQTLSIVLICNSCLAEILYGCNMLSIAIFTLENDRKQRIYQDSFCRFRDYCGYVGTSLLMYSLTVQTIYRYVIVVYPTQYFWQTFRIQSIFICFSWIFSFASLLPWLLTNSAIYNVDNQACILPFQFSIPIIYNVSLVYLIPISIIGFFYFKLVRYIRRISNRTTLTAQTLFQARRELVMVQRVITLVIILVILGLPYTIFMLMSFFTNPPKYHYRISIFFVDLGQTLIMIALFKFTQPVMNILLKFKHGHVNWIHPTIAT